MSSGYVSEAARREVRLIAGDRCGYCRSHQQYLLGPLEVEHIIPLARKGTNAESNLWLACPRCNRYKGMQIEAPDPMTGSDTPLFNPRTQAWSEHFRWDAEGVRIVGKTATGRATIEALQLNHEQALAVRRNWVAAGWHPPAN